jgi:hypothetical protein
MTSDQFKCLCPPGAQKIDASLELSGGRGLVQINCQTCGHGQAIKLPLEKAIALHDELHRHKPPPAAMANDEAPLTEADAVS